MVIVITIIAKIIPNSSADFVSRSSRYVLQHVRYSSLVNLHYVLKRSLHVRTQPFNYMHDFVCILNV